jgi:hypothetical protein
MTFPEHELKLLIYLKINSKINLKQKANEKFSKQRVEHVPSTKY